MNEPDIYPLPIELARFASTRPAIHAALRTLGQLGFQFTGDTTPFSAASDQYPTLALALSDTCVRITWPTSDCEDELIYDFQDPTHGEEAALRAVAQAISAARSYKSEVDRLASHLQRWLPHLFSRSK